MLRNTADLAQDRRLPAQWKVSARAAGSENKYNHKITVETYYTKRDWAQPIHRLSAVRSRWAYGGPTTYLQPLRHPGPPALLQVISLR